MNCISIDTADCIERSLSSCVLRLTLVFFCHQLQVLMVNKLSGSSCCSLVEGRGSSSAANPSHYLSNPTCPGSDSLLRVCFFYLNLCFANMSLILSTEATSPSWIFKVTFCLFFSGTPCYVDSEGVVRLLNRSLGSTWTPVCNTRDTCKSKSDHYWVVGVHENPQQLR